MRDARRELEAARAAHLEAQRIRERAAAAGLPPGAAAGDDQAALETVEERELREAMRLESCSVHGLVARTGGGRRLGAGAAPRPRDPPPGAITGDPALDEQLRALVQSEATGSAPRARAPSERRAAPGVVQPAAAGGAAGSPRTPGRTVSADGVLRAGTGLARLGLERPGLGRGGALAAVPQGLDSSTRAA